jgi:hypothetical protein
MTMILLNATSALGKFPSKVFVLLVWLELWTSTAAKSSHGRNTKVGEQLPSCMRIGINHNQRNLCMHTGVWVRTGLVESIPLQRNVT